MKFRAFALCGLVTTVSVVTYAQSAEQQLLACSAIASSDARLACYDTTANDFAPSESFTVGNWDVYEETNPVDDTKTIAFSTAAEEGVSRYGDEIRLYVRCMSKEIAALINWGDYLGMDSTQVTYRIGTSSAKTDTWYLSSDNTATFFSYNDGPNREFIDDLVNADNGRLVAQVTPYNEDTSTAVFNISGLGEVIDQVYGACE